ncbi:MFS transporter [Paenibacillus kandeliae]|uniref:MFS transporter n=1 Tax=Paenibacillus kandeliae TaxID=3231269 RepID=UPI003457AF41
MGSLFGEKAGVRKQAAERPVVDTEARQTLLRIRGFYLLAGLAGGMFNPYLSSMLVHGGMGSAQVGLLMSIGTLISILIQPIWGMLVDRFQQMRLVLMLSVAVPAVLSIFYQSPYFLVLTVIYTLSMVFAATQAPMSDSYALVAAQKAHTTYGAIRFLGSLGTAAGSYLGGLYISRLDVSLIWIPFLVFNLLAAALTFWLPRRSDESRVLSQSLSAGIRTLLGNKMFLCFLGGCLLVNQTLTAFNSYFVLSFQEAGGTLEMAGVGLFIASAANIPAMLIAARVIRRFGHERMLLVAAFAYILRWGIQYLFPIPWVMIAVQLLNGLSFGFFYISAVEYVSRITAKHMQATGQSIFNMVFVGLAGIAGNLLNGYLLESGGAAAMNLSCVISAFLGAVLLGYVALRSRQPIST